MATTNWQTYEPTEAEPWNLQRVVHLHRRAGFAAPWDVLQRDLAEGPQAAVDRLLEGQCRANQDGDFETTARTIGDAAMASGSPARLKAWWFYRMLLSPDPLGERLTLMWHNHFATSNRKVQDLVLMREQNELFRKRARSHFSELLAAVVKHTAMLVWLDADSNRKGHPNENLARELMELFTLGVGHYTEQDVREAARALTGWAVVDGKSSFRGPRHDEGGKTVFDRQGRLTGDDLLKILTDVPATSRRLTWRLCETFMGEGVGDQRSREELAAGLRTRDLDLAWGVETILRSGLFFSKPNLRSRVTTPVEYIVGALRSVELCQRPPTTLLLAEWAARMGQDLFYPPNVGGWNEGRAWLGARSISARINFAGSLAAGDLWYPVEQPDFSGLLQAHGVETTLEDATTWLAQLLWGDAPSIAVADVVSRARAAKNSEPLAVVVAQLLARPEHNLA